MEKPSFEFKENIQYRLSIVVHRHGPKQGVDGPLSSEGKKLTKDLYEDAYEGVAKDLDSGAIDIEYSPIHRARETAEIYTESVKSEDVRINSKTVDQRLSEGGITEEKEVLQNLIDENKGKSWIKGWLKMKQRPTPNVKTGKEAVADFSSWILDKIKNNQENGGNQQIEAFSHGPVMAAFLFLLQEKLNVSIIPENLEKEIFSGSLSYLSSMHLWTNPDDPGMVSIAFSGHEVDEVPIVILEELAKENMF